MWGENISLRALNYTHILPWVVSSSWFVHSQPSGGKRTPFPGQRAVGRARVVSHSGCSTAKTLICPSWQPWVSESLEREGIAVTVMNSFLWSLLKDWSQISPWGAFKEFYDVSCLSSVYRISPWKNSSFPSPDRNGVFPWTEPSSSRALSILSGLPQPKHSKKTRAQPVEPSQHCLTACGSWICAEIQALTLIPRCLSSADCPSKLIRKIINLHPLCLNMSNWLSEQEWIWHQP